MKMYKVSILASMKPHNVCPGSLDPFDNVSYNVEWVKTSWTCSSLAEPLRALKPGVWSEMIPISDILTQALSHHHAFY